MDEDEAPILKPKLRTPARRTVKRAEPSARSKRKPTAKPTQLPKPDLVELYGKSEGDETGPEVDCDVRGSSADEDLEIFEVCRIFTASHFSASLLIPLWVFSVQTA
jgi:hypothetical protein